MDNAGCAKAHVQTALGKSAWFDTRGSWEYDAKGERRT